MSELARNAGVRKRTIADIDDQPSGICRINRGPTKWQVLRWMRGRNGNLYRLWGSGLFLWALSFWESPTCRFSPPLTGAFRRISFL
ncbi:hypothetical protein DF3PB_4610001 [uncultured Defluviicoccus sp.]|uniref:Uncharacterized protein n=1 Tax=metagenome TaxID=256318 RepID=A0A380THB6_9ZZZZ|nr:hypothetical protein DF3PB_4610001 [uncultured Defluviicoccus sp.]